MAKYEIKDGVGIIPEGTTVIEQEAFKDCKDLTSIVIPDSVTEIGSDAFSGCAGLTSIAIPDSVTEIGMYAFQGCTGLTSIVIPDSVTEIGSDAFSGCAGLTSIVIPDSVTKIGDNAFEGCTGLTSIVIPDSVTKIGSGAFSGCTGLTSIVVSKGNEVYDSRNNCNAIIKTGSNTLIAGLKNTVIPDSVEKIAKEAFWGCTGLTSIVIPDSVTAIGWYAFSGCTGLTSIAIPDSVTEIGNGAFSGCTGLTSIAIPDSVTKIGWYAFQGCTGLTSIVIPDSVTEIGACVFSGCTGLTSIVVSEGNKKYDSRDNCNGIIETESNALIAVCKSTVIPDSVMKIGQEAFKGCTGLTSIVIPDSVTEIGYAVFNGCTGLTSIVIPDSVTKISWNAFNGCTGLTSIVIPDSVTEIGDEAFSGCTGLTSIVIPDSVKTIGGWAFSDCVGLTTASVLGPVKLMNATFKDCTALECVTLGAGIKKIIITDDDDKEEACAFGNCSALKTINVPAKKADYYKSRLPEELHGLIVELPAEKKAKAKKTAKKVIKGGKVEVTIQGHLEILEYCSQSLINEEESFNDNYYVTYGWSGFDSIKVGTETIKKIDSYLVKKAYFAELFKTDGPHPLPVDARWRDEENVEATYIIELADDEEFDIDKIEFVEPSDAPEVFEDCSFVADHILYDGKEIVTDSLSDYSAEDMFNSPGWEGEIDVI